MTLHKNLLRLALAVALLLLIPLVAMQFNTGVNWSVADFVVAGVLLLGTGLVFLLVASRTRPRAYKLAVGIAVAAALLLVWGNLAVGFIGNEDNPANLLYGGVLVVGFIGAVVAQLRPQGMARALFATALAHVAVPFVAMLIWRPELTMGVLWVVVLNTLFAGLWVASALLFRRAGATEQQAA
ncbi:hypothetical protein FY528_09270 [Hymenobacter lutimineralis]|uniref:Uncharacterized protein n=1 Tax=Hymenobacter lutimineralis TaxID=2606448 RepID=A0A5D6V3C2_9BACT|nr:hypothetical protein [Hymenobacter lutimineralis]TYZ10046.1 hypothetical protein FY528_09270 [Hymenobacter lutimineralis]